MFDAYTHQHDGVSASVTYACREAPMAAMARATAAMKSECGSTVPSASRVMLRRRDRALKAMWARLDGSVTDHMDCLC